MFQFTVYNMRTTLSQSVFGKKLAVLRYMGVINKKRIYIQKNTLKLR